MRRTTDFSLATLDAERQWNHIQEPSGVGKTASQEPVPSNTLFCVCRGKSHSGRLGLKEFTIFSLKKKKVRKRQKKFGNEEPPFFADSPHFCLRKRRSLCFWLEKSGLSISPGQLAGQKQLSTVLEGLGLPLCGHHGKVCDGACRWPSPLSPHPRTCFFI